MEKGWFYSQFCIALQWIYIAIFHLQPRVGRGKRCCTVLWSLHVSVVEKGKNLQYVICSTHILELEISLNNFHFRVYVLTVRSRPPLVTSTMNHLMAETTRKKRLVKMKYGSSGVPSTPLSYLEFLFLSEQSMWAASLQSLTDISSSTALPDV